MNVKDKRQQGFTLIEILIALFIFSILSLIMTEGLKRMMTFHEATVQRSKLLRELQFAFLIFSRDLEQTINRPVRNSFGQLEPAFVGRQAQLQFTHMGHVSANSGVESQLQRVSYQLQGNIFSRSTSYALDAAKNSEISSRALSTHIQSIRFEYYSRKTKRFYNDWPLKNVNEGGKAQTIPDAVRIYVSIKNLGQMSQLYVIPSGN